MTNNSPTYYWDYKNKKWFYYNDEGKVCIETDIGVNQSYGTKGSRSPIASVGKLASELAAIGAHIDILIEYIMGIPEEDPTESEILQGEINDNIITKDRLYEICILRAIKYGIKYSKRYYVDPEETIQNALLGACQGIDTYNEGPFIEHLNRFIREEVMNGIPIGEHICCIPWRMKPYVYKILQKAENECLDAPSSTEFFAQVHKLSKTILHLSDQTATNLASVLVEPLNIDLLVEMEDFSLSNNDVNDEELSDMVYRTQAKDVVAQAIDKLKTDREKEVIYLRFGFVGEPMSLDEIGKKFGVSRERIRQIEKKALDKLALWSQQLYLVADIDNRKLKVSKTMPSEPAAIDAGTTYKTAIKVHSERGTRTIVFEY